MDCNMSYSNDKSIEYTFKKMLTNVKYKYLKPQERYVSEHDKHNGRVITAKSIKQQACIAK
jgi:hypothetical protein